PAALAGGAGDPVPADEAGDLESALVVPAGDAALQYRTDVVDLQVHPVEPFDQPVPGLRDLLHAPGPVVLRAAQLDGLGLAGLAQSETGVLAHGLVQAVAGDLAGVLLDDQGLVDEGGQHVEGLCRRYLPAGADPLDVVEGEPAGEHTQSP